MTTARAARRREVGEHVAAARDVGATCAVARFERDVLAREQQRARAVACASACAHATAVSTVSHGRQTSSCGMSRRLAACSIDWCVGPSSPRPIESCVNTKIDRGFISAAMRMALRM